MQINNQLELQGSINAYEKDYTEEEEEEDEDQHEDNAVEIVIAKNINEADEDLETDDFEQSNKAQRRHYGNNLVFLFFREEPLITIGPHWPFNICMVTVFGLSSYFLLFYIVPFKAAFLQYISWAVAILQMSSYLACALKNPGIVTAKKGTSSRVQFQCIICRIPRSGDPLYHCEDCDVCIKGYDHHCPWTGKCIGDGNILFFYVFIIMILVYFVFFLIVIIPDPKSI